MKPFSKFGLELTYMPKIELPEYVYQHKFAWEAIFSQIIDTLNTHEVFKGVRHLGWNMEEDDCNLEIKSPKFETWENFKSDYSKVDQNLRKLSFENSSNVCMISEGGCHINFDLSEFKLSEKVMEKKLRSLINYILSNPSIVWAFLSPFDNVSSKIDNNPNQKGEFLIAHYDTKRVYKESVYEDVKIIYSDGREEMERRKISSGESDYIKEYERLELRFFMMPRDLTEMDLHFQFANTLMNYVWESKDHIEHKSGNGYLKDRLVRYNYNRASKEILQVCKEIGFKNTDDLIKYKLPLLKERMNLGPKYKN